MFPTPLAGMGTGALRSHSESFLFTKREDAVYSSTRGRKAPLRNDTGPFVGLIPGAYGAINFPSGSPRPAMRQSR